MTAATLTLLAAASGCCSIENADCCPSFAGCCRDVTGPVMAEPYLSEPVAAPTPYDPVIRWLGTAQGLVYEWSNGNGANLERRGKATIGKNGVMQLSGGAYLPKGLNAKLLESCSRTDELSIEVTLMTNNKKQSGPARIVSFSRDANERNFTLGQDGDKLILRLRTERNDKNGTNPQVTLGEIVTGEPMHVVVSYRAGQLLCCVNGKPVKKTGELQGDFHNWEPMALILGDEVNGGRDWQGSIERLAIRSRFLDADEAARQFELTQQGLSTGPAK
jgi:hypothetical protein